MFGKTHMIRRTGMVFALGVSVAAFAVPTALGFDGRSPDTRDAADQAQLNAVVDGRSPDTLDAAYQTQLSTLVDGRSPDTLDAAYQAQLPTVGTLTDGRSPDAIDAGVVGRTQVVEITSTGGFNWGDFGIGMAVALGSIFILLGLGAGMRGARQARHRLGSA
jgi:hypothetical protein